MDKICADIVSKSVAKPQHPRVRGRVFLDKLVARVALSENKIYDTERRVENKIYDTIYGKFAFP